MIKYRKKLLTNMLAVTIAGLFSVEALAVTVPIKTVPLRGTSSVAKEINTPSSTSIQLKGGVKIDTRQQLVTLNLVNSDLRQVLRMLADKAGKNIIIDDSVGTASSSGSNSGAGQSMGAGSPSESMPPPPSSNAGSSGGSGTISLDLVNVTVNKAFEYIMTVKQLTYWLDGNTLIVATNQKAAELGINKTEIKPVKIKYVDAQKVADFLNSNIFSLNRPDISKSAIVTSNPSTNEVYIFGNNNDYELAKKVIARLDTKPQVNTFNVNYANPMILASKICMTVFQNTEASSGSSSSGSSTSNSSSSSSSSGSSSEGPSTSASQISTICSGNSSGSSSGGSSSSSSSNSESSSSSGSGSLSPFSSPSYIVLADPGLNQITLFGGTQEQVNLAQEIIKNFDKKEPQVYLEISILELSEEGSKDFSNALYVANGSRTAFSTAKGNGTIGYTQKPIVLGKADNGYVHGPDGTGNPINIGGSLINLPTPLANVFGTGVSGSSSWVPYNNIYGAINSVITSNKGRVLANPRIIASNNVESTINISEEYVRRQQSVSTSTTSNSSTTTIQPEIGQAGIELKVTPKISPNGYVTLNMEPSYSAVKGGGLVKSREFKSDNVRVKDGETLIIAGLIQETETNEQKKTPLLADIPVIGTLFKDQNTLKNRSELIFMITPRIVKDNDTESL